jgi:hypothetical protein
MEPSFEVPLKEQDSIIGMESVVAEASDAPDLDIAISALKDFIAADSGQELILTMQLVLGYVQELAGNCRTRHRFHGFFKAAAGAAAVTGGVIVIVAGAVLSGGTALPAQIAVASAFFAGGSITLAAAAGVQVSNTLISLGFDKKQAELASGKMLALTELIQPWDIKLNDLLHAGGSLGSLSDSIGAVCQGISGSRKKPKDKTAKSAIDVASTAKTTYGAVQQAWQAKDAIVLRNVIESFLDVGLDASVAGGTTSSFGAPQAMFGLVKAGSTGARGLFFALSGVGVAFSLVDVIGGLSSMFSGQSEAADCLDAHADKLCLLLHIMAIAGRGTPASDKVFNEGLPPLLLARVRSCAVHRPSYRFGDLTKSVTRNFSGKGPRKHDVYFGIAISNRNRETEVVSLQEQCEVLPLENPQVIIMRILKGDRTFSLQMCARRGFGHRLTCGDSSISKAFELDLPSASDDPCTHHCDDSTELELAYQVLDVNAPLHGEASMELTANCTPQHC